jgi:hypothetical protein
VRASLFFRPTPAKTLYSLPLSASTELQRGMVEPDGELTLKLTDETWNLYTHIFQHYNVNTDRSSVKFRVDLVQFSDGTQWSKGIMIHRDPYNPNTWKTVGGKTKPN